MLSLSVFRNNRKRKISFEKKNFKNDLNGKTSPNAVSNLCIILLLRYTSNEGSAVGPRMLDEKQIRLDQKK